MTGRIRDAVEEAILGEQLDSRTVGRARSAAMAELHRMGRRGRVQVRPAPGGVEVVCVLDPGTPRVQQVVIRI